MLDVVSFLRTINKPLQLLLFFFFDYLELHFQSPKDKDETREVNYRKDL